MYICYIIQSINYPENIYVGTTNDFKRRIRQHNRELQGGAKHTKKYLPWKIYKTAIGFEDRNQAMQFEYAIQRPEKSRYFKYLEKKNRKRTFKKKQVDFILTEITKNNQFSHIEIINSLP